MIWISTFLLIIIGSYIVWKKLTTPSRLLLKNIEPGESLNIEYVKQLGGAISSGQTRPLVVNKNLVYVGIGPRLAILDISDLSNIYLVGQSDIIHDLIGEVVLVGNYVYIAPGVYGDNHGTEQKLHIIDVSDSTRPQYLGAYAPRGKYVSSVYVFGKHLYITAKDTKSNPVSSADDLYILDISNPPQPKEISHYDFEAGISDAAASGNYIYAATSKPGLRILDVSDLRNPKEINTLYPSETGYSLITSGNYLYLSGSMKDNPWGFHIIDISNSRAPVEIGLKDEGAVELVSVNDDTAYFWSLGDQRSIIYVNVSNSKAPRDIGNFEFDGRVVSIQEKVAFVMDANRLVLFDLSYPLKPVELGSYITLIPEDTLPEFHFAETKGVMPVSTDMFILDFSNPLSPVIANRYLVGYRYIVESIHGDFVYMDSMEEIQVLDISDPTEPAIVWRHDGYDKNGEPFILATAGKYAYVINPIDGLYVYDIANPANPTLMSHQSDLKGFDGFDDFAVSGNYLYILDGRDIHILDASDPTAIAEVGLYKFPSSGNPPLK